MLTLDECFAFCDLSEDEIEAISEHEHVPNIVAAEMGQCLLATSEGRCLIKRYISEDAEQALSHGLCTKADRLHGVLQRFECTYPESAH